MEADAGARQQFEREGYLVFDPQIPDALIAQARQDLERYFPAQPGVPERQVHGAHVGFNRIQDAWRMSDAVRRIACWPQIQACLQNLYARRPRPFQTLNFQRGTEQPVHADVIHFDSRPTGYMCGVWVALEDIDADNGPLVYYPGSQRLPAVGLRDLGPEVARLMRRLRWPRLDVHAHIYRPYYEPHIAALIQARNLPPRYGTVRRGQAIVWAAKLLHGGSAQRDRARTRWSQVTHYYFDGCRYCTPLHERSGPFGPVVAWRHPRWIA